MPFDPDQYLSEKTGQSSSFDPDKYLSEKAGSVQGTQTSGDSSFAQKIYENHPMLWATRKIVGGIEDAIKEENGSDESPIKTDLAGGDLNRVKQSFGDHGALAKKLISQGFVDVSQDKSGNLIAKKPDGKWYRDEDNFLGHSLNWLESSVGKALPLAGGIAGGLGTGPGAVTGAAAGGGVGEAARIGIGKLIGVNDSSPEEMLGDIGKESLVQGVGRAIAPVVESGLIKPLVGTIGEVYRGAGELADKAALSFGRSHLRPTPLHAAKLGEEKVNQAVRESLDSGAIKAGQKVKNTFSELTNLKESAGASKGDIVQDITEKGGGLNRETFLRNLENEANGVDSTGVNSGEASRLRSILSAVRERFSPKNKENPGTWFTEKTTVSPEKTSGVYVGGTREVPQKTNGVVVGLSKDAPEVTNGVVTTVGGRPQSVSPNPNSLTDEVIDNGSNGFLSEFGGGKEPYYDGTYSVKPPTATEPVGFTKFGGGNDPAYDMVYNPKPESTFEGVGISKFGGGKEPVYDPVYNPKPETLPDVGKLQFLRREGMIPDPVYNPSPEIPQMPLSEADQIAVDLGKRAYGAERDPSIGKHNPYYKGLMRMNSVASDAVENEVGRVAPDQVGAFQAQKRAFGNFSNAKNMAKRTSNLQDGGLYASITDRALWFDALHSVGKGNPLPLLLIPARLLTKGRLSSTGAVAMDQVAKHIAENPQAFEKFISPLSDAAARGGNAIAATTYTISKSPEYQEILKKVAEEKQGPPDKMISIKDAQQKFQEAQ